MRQLLRVFCWLIGHDYRVLRQWSPCNNALIHLHLYAACDADCARCGAEWRDYLNHVGHHGGFDAVAEAKRLAKGGR